MVRRRRHHPATPPRLGGQLADTDVEIFLGTWCGDSKTWVPRFSAYWQAIGLDPARLTLIGVHPNGDHYKQSPDREEVGKALHRVPTFIFRRGGEEIGRIVETPRTDLETDLAQIALGFPPLPRYAAANYLLDTFESTPVDSIQQNIGRHWRAIRKDLGRSNELNTLGYVLKARGETKAAWLTFYINYSAHQHVPNVIDSFAEGTADMGDLEKAIELYERVLELKPEDENATEALTALRVRMDERDG